MPLTYEIHCGKTHVVYAVYFTDGRIKIGRTKDATRRISYYAQEARRNRVKGITWWSCAPTHEISARDIENQFCRQLRGQSMPRHREWFVGDSDAFRAVVSALERLRNEFADEDEDISDLPFMGSCGNCNTGAMQ